MSTSLYIYIYSAFVDTALMGFLTLACFYRYHKRDNGSRLLGMLMLIGLLANVIAYQLISRRITDYSNLPSSIYDFAMIIICSMLYNHQTKGKYKHIFIAVTIVYFIIGIANILYIQQSSISSYNKLLGSFILIGYTILFFYRLMQDLPANQIHTIPMFWFNSALLIYHAGTVFLFAFTSYMIDVMTESFVYYMMFHNIVSIIQHLIMFIGAYYSHKNMHSAVIN